MKKNDKTTRLATARRGSGHSLWMPLHPFSA